MLIGLIILSMVLCVVILVFTYKYTCIQDTLDNANWVIGRYVERIDVADTKIKETEGKLKQAVSRNKSVEVRTGHIVEKVAPFLDVFGHNPRHAQFLGNPIDYVVFGDDCITFVEVKSGKSRLSQKQNRIKKLVEAKKVSFETVRVDYE